MSRSDSTTPPNDATAAAAGFTRALAERVSALGRGGVPADPAALACVADLVADHLGVSLRGWDEPWTAMARAAALEEGAASAATLYDGTRTGVRTAAFCNGAAGHSLELDDTHDSSLTHPGTVVIPAALALGEARGASGRQVLEAIAAGYEAQCLLGMAMGQPLIERGMHPTATLGTFGAAAAAAHLRGLDAAATARAFGIAASMCAGLMQFSQDAEGTMVKRLYGGLPAERGLLAASLAAHGLTGPAGAVEGRYGIAAMLAGLAPGELATHPRGWRGAPLQVTRVSVKLYPCCKNLHPAIEAIETLRARTPFHATEVERVDALGPRAMIEHHLETRPRSTMAAQYSLPFTVAVALAGDPGLPESFDDAACRRPDLLALADRVAGHIDPELNALFPAHFAGAVRILLRDGRVLEERVIDCLGTPAQPIDRAGIARKFRAMTRARLAPAAQDAVLDACAGLDGAVSLAPLLRSLTG